METNESIAARRVVSLKEHEVLGSVSSLRVDCGTLAVSALIVDADGAERVLPFEGIHAIGDAFVMVDSSERLVAAASAEEKAALDGFRLVEVEAFSKVGNDLAPVKGYEFDPVFGTVESLTLVNDATFPREDFVFFANDFVFVDDHAKSAAELRAEAAEAKPQADAPSDEDRELMDFLIGQTLTDAVTSEDGAFSVESGMELTRELVEAAYAHGALLPLTLSV